MTHQQQMEETTEEWKLITESANTLSDEEREFIQRTNDRILNAEKPKGPGEYPIFGYE